MQQAQAAWPRAAFSFNVAQLQRELGMCSEARKNYRAFLEQETVPARRREAQRALAELAECKPSANPLTQERCVAWTATAPAPAQVATAQVARERVPLVAASTTTSSARGTPRYLPWIFAGAAGLCAGLAGYELTQMAAAERDIARARSWTPELAAREHDGQSAETLFWVFGSAGVLALGSAIVLALTADDGASNRTGR